MQEKLLGRYTILRELGRDAIGKVYAARDGANGAMVALQTLDPALLDAADAKLPEAFLQNARAAARLNHANIVKVRDAGEAGGTAYVATDLVEGKSLREMLDGEPLQVARAIRIFDDIASALAYAHEQGMVHRGVRPSNIVVLPSRVAKIGDFGIGQIGEEAQRYLSPEQVRGDPVDHRSDLFSLGAVLYEMLAGRPAFEGASAKEIKESILRAEPLPPSELNPLVPGALDRMALGLLAQRPEDRPATARLLLRDLQRLEEGLGLRPGPSALPLRAEPPRREEFQRQAPHFGAAPFGPAVDEPDERVMRHRREMAEQKRRRSPSTALAVLALAVAVIAIGVTVFSRYLPGVDELLAFVKPRQQAPAAVAAPIAPAAAAEPIKPPTVAATKVDEPLPVVTPPVLVAPKPIVVETKPIVVETKPIVVETKPIMAGPPNVSPPPEEPKQTAAVEPAPQPKPQAKKAIPEPQAGGAMAKLIIAVSPQGELYVDGKHYGSTPPTTTFDLEPGMHRIEIRNGSRRPYLTYMTLEPGDERRIQHDFNAKPMRPPV